MLLYREAPWCMQPHASLCAQQQSAPEVFFRKFKFWDGGDQDAPPVFLVEGTTYLHTRDGGLHLVATTRENVSPSLVLELLKRIGSIIRVCSVKTT